jgi:hypothetical protein
MLGCILLPRSSGPGSVGPATSSGRHAYEHDRAVLEPAADTGEEGGVKLKKAQP